MREEIWIIHDREIWELCRDGRAKYSDAEVFKLRLATNGELMAVNKTKKVFPFSEVVTSG